MGGLLAFGALQKGNHTMKGIQKVTDSEWSNAGMCITHQRAEVEHAPWVNSDDDQESRHTFECRCTKRTHTAEDRIELMFDLCAHGTVVNAVVDDEKIPLNFGGNYGCWAIQDLQDANPYPPDLWQDHLEFKVWTWNPGRSLDPDEARGAEMTFEFYPNPNAKWKKRNI